MAKKEVVNQRIGAIAPSASLSIASKAKAMKAAGRDVCDLAAGEPDFDTPEHIKEAAAKALADGHTKYTPVAGIPALREAIAAKLLRENGLHYTADQVIVCSGAKHALYNVFMALLREGDEVIIPSPYWLSYPEMVRMAGGESVFLPGREEKGFRVSPDELEAAMTSRTKAVIINSPSNPTGCVYTREELRALADVALRHGVYIVADEIYEKLLYDGAEHHSVGNLAPEILEWTITVNGFSKAYAMTGWRLGYVAAPLFLTKAMSALQSHSTSGTTSFAQYGAVAALNGPHDFLAAMGAAFTERRAYLLRRLEDISGVTCSKPMGAFYAMSNIARFGLDSISFAQRLLEEQNVATVPGIAFGAPDHIRLSYACGMDVLEKSLDRLGLFIESL